MYPYLQLENKIKSVLADLRLPDNILKVPSVSGVDWTIDIKSIFDLNKEKFSSIKELSDFVYQSLKDQKNGLINQIVQQGIFVNIITSDKYLKRVIENSPVRKILPNYLKERVVVDYSSPNIAKQMSMGHFRATILGDVFANILEQLGGEVIRWNYIGDWGTPFGKFIYSYLFFMKIYKKPEEINKLSDELRKKIEDIGIGQRFVDNLKKDPINILGKLYASFNDIPDPNKENKARYYFKLLSEGKDEYLKLWKKFRKISLEEFQKIYNILGVKFDICDGEYYAEKYVPQVINDLKKKGYLVHSQEAYIVVFKKLKDKYVPLKKEDVKLQNLKSNNYEILLIRKKDGTTLYATRELAMILIRTKKYKTDKVYYVVGKEQTLHFKLVFSLAEALEYIKKEMLIHIPFGLILIGGKKMSSRRGDIIKVKDVIDLVVDKILSDYGNRIDKKVAVKLSTAAIVINDLKNDPIKDIDFIIDKMIQLQGDTGIYLVYSYVRLKSLIKKIEDSLQVKEEEIDLALLSKEEKELLKNLEKFVYYYILAYKYGKPNFIVNHLFNIMKLFNSWYSNTEKIINLSKKERISKLGVLKVIKKYLDIVFITFKLPIDVERI